MIHMMSPALSATRQVGCRKIRDLEVDLALLLMARFLAEHIYI